MAAPEDVPDPAEPAESGAAGKEPAEWVVLDPEAVAEAAGQDAQLLHRQLRTLLEAANVSVANLAVAVGMHRDRAGKIVAADAHMAATSVSNLLKMVRALGGEMRIALVTERVPDAVPVVSDALRLVRETADLADLELALEARRLAFEGRLDEFKKWEVEVWQRVAKAQAAGAQLGLRGQEPLAPLKPLPKSRHSPVGRLQG